MATIGSIGCSGGEGSENAAPDTSATQDHRALQESLSLEGAIVLPRDAPVFGKSITRWTEHWWRWLSRVPAPNNPDLVLNTACGVDQEGPVFFVPTFLGSTSYARACDVPLGKAVLVPVQVVLDDYPCPNPGFKPAPGQSLEDFLRKDVTQFNDLYRNLTATVDAHFIDLTDHRHTTGLFTNTVDASLLPLIPDPCMTGYPQPALSDGWWIMLLLPPGQHDVHVTGTFPSGNTFEHDWQLRVNWDSALDSK